MPAGTGTPCQMNKAPDGSARPREGEATRAAGAGGGAGAAEVTHPRLPAETSQAPGAAVASGGGGSGSGASAGGGAAGGGDGDGDGSGSGGGDDDQERRNLRKLSNRDVRDLKDNGFDPHKIKGDCGCRPNSHFDLFKDRANATCSSTTRPTRASHNPPVST